MRRARSRPRRAALRGFTLIELLVVIAVIAILIGVLLPALGAARRLARQAKDMSNQRQIAVAMTLYANDWNDYVPRESGSERGQPTDIVEAELPWAMAFRPYLDRLTSWDEPVGDLFVNAWYYHDPSRAEDHHNIHYVNNGFMFTSPGVQNPAKRHKGPTPLSRVRNPSQVAYLTTLADDPEGRLYEAFITIGGGGTDFRISQMYDIWSPIQVAGAPGQRRIQPDRFGRGSNAAFMDGHARLLATETLQDVATWDDGDYVSARTNPYHDN